MEKYLEQFREWLRFRNYTTATQRGYVGSVRLFWRWSERRLRLDKSFDRQNAHREYIGERLGQVSWSTVNGDYSAIKMFYEQVLHRTWDMEELPRPRAVHKEPDILSGEEVSRIINATSNIRDRSILLLAYATGMRLSELSSLRLTDINGSRHTIHIRCAKGLKDRIIPIPEEILVELRKYYIEYHPQVYLFGGELPNTPLSCRTIQYIFKNAKQQSGVKSPASMHTFRHCFATHLVESGVDVRSIQLLLGHANIGTSSRYLHLSEKHLQNLPNPALKLCNPTTHVTR